MQIPDGCELLICGPTAEVFVGQDDRVDSMPANGFGAKLMSLAKLLMVSTDGNPHDVLDRIIEKIRTLVGDDDREEFTAGVRERLGVDRNASDAECYALISSYRMLWETTPRRVEPP